MKHIAEVDGWDLIEEDEQRWTLSVDGESVVVSTLEGVAYIAAYVETANNGSTSDYAVGVVAERLAGSLPEIIAAAQRGANDAPAAAVLGRFVTLDEARLAWWKDAD